MPSAKRRIDPGVVQQLLAEPHRFQFFQAMRVLERVFQRQGVKAGQAVPMRVRFRNTLSLGFPTADLDPHGEAYSLKGELLEGDALVAALEAGGEGVGEVHLTPQFMGLLGTTGALPLHYTETLQEREIYLRDRTARAFLDIFSNRAVALHYAAWKKHRLALQYELDRRERFLPLILSLLGMGMSGLRERMVDEKSRVFDQAVAYYAGAIRQRPVSAVMLKRVLGDYFRVPVQLEQFVGAWYKVPAGQATRLGMANATLGSSALAGDRVWQRDLRLRLRIGPLRRHEFDALLPGGDAANALSKWLSLLTGGGLEYEVQLVLHADDVRPSAIGKGHAARLGWDGYLATRPATEHRGDTTYGIHTLQ
ncbi:type VI secretion system baseplate subunit TssG [Stenotrophomonas tumulicola]|uniref:Type VI secretion system baseplate subunit TssG n=1 Tax=Stenotrophomonas tumulicola TaxID=1685415 RepID=A0A7W3FJU1_9GAMM|nr:type VI secretion system baseplate subunit TssG [Stenotrophomonas tumulicola]MBA8680775.1 type VI secretion system baseplate subunit TssG [Stenotrophomonas tumulicola]